MVGNDDPVVFPLNSSKVTIGSADSADVVINADGVSRKHVTVLTEGDTYYVVDQGSTNGTYINEERLVPGRKVEFTSFFPVRMGDNVLVTLISDEEGSEPIRIDVPVKEKPSDTSRHDSTTVISLKELTQAGKTEKLVKNLNEKRTIRSSSSAKAAPPPKPKKKTNFVPFVAFLILAAGAYYNFIILKSSEPDSTPVKAEKPGQRIEVVQPAEPVKDPLIPEAELTPPEKLGTLLTDMKCVTDLEQYLCQQLRLTEPWGVTQVGLNFNIMLDATRYKTEALNIIKRSDDPVLWKEVAAAFALAEMLQRGLDYEKLKDAKLLFALYETAEDGSKNVYVVLAIYPEEMKKLIGLLEFSTLFAAEKGGLSAIEPLKRYYRTYPL